MLQLGTNTTLNQTYLVLATLVYMTYQSRYQYPPSSHSSVHGWCYKSTAFNYFLLEVVLDCFPRSGCNIQ